MADLIDRQAALAELDKAAWGKAWDKALAAEMLKSLPSAQQWIPCSKRLPNIRESVILTTKGWTGEGCYWATTDYHVIWKGYRWSAT